MNDDNESLQGRLIPSMALLGALMLTGCVRGNVTDGPASVGLKPIDSPLPSPVPPRSRSSSSRTVTSSG